MNGVIDAVTAPKKEPKLKQFFVQLFKITKVSIFHSRQPCKYSVASFSILQALKPFIEFGRTGDFVSHTILYPVGYSMSTTTWIQNQQI